jgi:hypothetical protein
MTPSGGQTRWDRADLLGVSALVIVCSVSLVSWLFDLSTTTFVATLTVVTLAYLVVMVTHSRRRDR